MCLGIPMQVVAIDGYLARCSAKGVERDVSLFLLQEQTGRHRRLRHGPRRIRDPEDDPAGGALGVGALRPGSRCRGGRDAMHELAICQALIEQVEAIARQRAARVARVRVAVGPLSGVEPRLLERAYPLACAGTVAEGSELAIDEVPVRVRCRDCGAESPRARTACCAASAAAGIRDLRAAMNCC